MKTIIRVKMIGEDGCSNLVQENRGGEGKFRSCTMIFGSLFLLLIITSFSYYIIRIIAGDLSCADLFDNLRSIYTSLITVHFENLFRPISWKIFGYIILSSIGPLLFVICCQVLERQKTERKNSTETMKDVWRFFRGKNSYGILFAVLAWLFLVFGYQSKLLLDFLTRYILLVILHFLIFSACYLSIEILSRFIEFVSVEELLENKLLGKIKNIWDNRGEEFVKISMILFYLYLSSYYVLNQIVESEKLMQIKIYIPNLILFVLLIYVYKRFFSVFIELIANYLIYEYLFSKGDIEEGEDVSQHDFYARNFKIIRDILGTLFILLFIIVSSDLRRLLLDLIKALIGNYAMSFAVGIPVLIFLLILLIDPYREGEIITIGEKTGKVVKLNPLFSEIVTLENEKVYIPNALLLARQFSRLTFRSKGEIGLLVRFTATLGYKYKHDDIENRFREIIRNIEEDEKKVEESELRKFVKERVLKCPSNQIEKTEEAQIEISEFKEEFLCLDPKPFVSIEEFRDHGIVYSFNVYVKKPFFLPLIRSFIMKKTFENFEKGDIYIMTPLQIEHASRTYNV